MQFERIFRSAGICEWSSEKCCPQDGGDRVSKRRCTEIVCEIFCPGMDSFFMEERIWEEITEKMAADFQKEKPITIRCCMNRVTPEVLKEKLEAEGAKVEAHPYLPYAFYLSDYDYLEGLESFQEGLFAVQDISSMFVGELADPKAGDHVIDVCAAPGGKSLHVAEKLQLADEVAVRENRTEEKIDGLKQEI